MEEIRSRDVSVVVPGPLFAGRAEGIERCLTSLRATLPDAEIVVSTWRDEETRGLDRADRVIASEDPGCFWESPDRPYNLNRLLISTVAGLRVASRRYCLKFRADLALMDASFLRIDPPRAGSLFSRPVTITNLYVRDPERFPLLFHVADTAQFGLTEDLLSFWQNEPFLRSEVLHDDAGHSRIGCAIRLFPEQALTLRWLQRRGVDVGLPHAFALSPTLLGQWADVLRLNFSLRDWQSAGIAFPARMADDPSVLATLLAPERIAIIDRQPFSYCKALVAKYLDPVFLVHARLGPLVSLMRHRMPRLYRVLRRSWIQGLQWREARLPKHRKTHD